MKIISGKYRGKTLKTLDGEHTRPTTSRVKESIFNIIQFNISDSSVLDLFAGSGQMGIETLSRGATSCDFVDSNKSACSIVTANLKICEIPLRCTQTDYKSFLQNTKKTYDIIFLDPPYGTDLIKNSVNLINNFKLLNKCGIIVCETSINDTIDVSQTDFCVHKSYKYGTIIITILKIKD